MAGSSPKKPKLQQANQFEKSLYDISQQQHALYTDELRQYEQKMLDEANRDTTSLVAGRSNSDLMQQASADMLGVMTSGQGSFERSGQALGRAGGEAAMNAQLANLSAQDQLRAGAVQGGLGLGSTAIAGTHQVGNAVTNQALQSYSADYRQGLSKSVGQAQAFNNLVGAGVQAGGQAYMAHQHNQAVQGLQQYHQDQLTLSNPNAPRMDTELAYARSIGGPPTRPNPYSWRN